MQHWIVGDSLLHQRILLPCLGCSSCLPFCFLARRIEHSQGGSYRGTLTFLISLGEEKSYSLQLQKVILHTLYAKSVFVNAAICFLNFAKGVWPGAAGWLAGYHITHFNM
jgi:hypothetical protein